MACAAIVYCYMHHFVDSHGLDGPSIVHQSHLQHSKDGFILAFIIFAATTITLYLLLFDSVKKVVPVQLKASLGLGTLKQSVTRLMVDLLLDTK